MSDDLQGCKPCDCDVGGAVDGNCDQQTGQCTCRPHITSRKCDQVSQGYFVMSMDWERYEAEKARGIGVTIRRLPSSYTKLIIIIINHGGAGTIFFICRTGSSLPFSLPFPHFPFLSQSPSFRRRPPLPHSLPSHSIPALPSPPFLPLSCTLSPPFLTGSGGTL